MKRLLMLLSVAWMFLAVGQVHAGVTKVLFGATGEGAIDLAFGSFQPNDGSNQSHKYGYGSVSVDEFFKSQEYEDFYPDQLFPENGPALGSMKLGLDISTDNLLKVLANSFILDSNSTAGTINRHAGKVSFSILEDSEVVASYVGGASVSVVLRSPFGDVWSQNSSNAFSIAKGSYWLDYLMASEVDSQDAGKLGQGFDLSLAFTPAGLPPSNPPQDPPPSGEVPEPATCMIVGGLLLVHLRKRVARC